MPFTALLPGSTQCDTLVQGHVVADNARFSNDHSHTVINEEALSDFRSRVYFNASEKARCL
jgi:hypothetical protein